MDAILSSKNLKAVILETFGSGNAAGSAYLYVRNGDAWTEKQKLTASDADTFDFFGYSVAIDGDVVIIGAFGDDLRCLIN